MNNKLFLWGSRMDINTIFYFRELAKELNMTKISKKLFISQQTLSKRIINLEEELGVNLFFRQPKLELTDAGKLFLNFSNNLWIDYDNLEKSLFDISQENKGNIEFGAGQLRLKGCLPSIIPNYFKKYPNVKINVIEDISSNLEQLIVDSTLDIAVIAIEKNKSNLDLIYTMKDQIYVCIPNHIINKYYGNNYFKNNSKLLSGIDLKEISKLPFLCFKNRIGDLIDKCFYDSRVEPNVIFSTDKVGTISDLGLLEIGAFFGTQISLMLVKNKLSSNMNILPLVSNNKFVYSEISIVANKIKYRPKYLNYFIRLLIEYFDGIKVCKLAKIAN